MNVVTYAACWAEENFSGCEPGDKRRSARLVRVASDLVCNVQTGRAYRSTHSCSRVMPKIRSIDRAKPGEKSLHLADAFASRSENGALLQDPTQLSMIDDAVWEALGIAPEYLDEAQIIGEVSNLFADTMRNLLPGKAR